MKRSVMLTITSLLSILLMTFHLSDDIVRGFEPGGFRNITGVLMLVVWLYGTLVLAERRSGYIIILLGSILGTVVPMAHMRGAGLVGGRIANSSGMHFWVWTLITLQVTAMFSLVLSMLGLWSLPWRRSKWNEMKEATKRSILRLIHIVLAIPIVGYVYSPFQELPNYAPVVRFVSIPILVLTGFWMWKGHAVRRLISKIGKK